MVNTVLEMLLKIIFVLVLIFTGVVLEGFNILNFSWSKEAKSQTLDCIVNKTCGVYKNTL